MRRYVRSDGIALLTALIVLAITAALAYALTAETGLAIRRTAGSASQEQAREISAATEALAASLLRAALEDPNASLHGAQRWARPRGCAWARGRARRAATRWAARCATVRRLQRWI
jgi:type II secretory pathway component PulK